MNSNQKIVATFVFAIALIWGGGRLWLHSQIPLFSSKLGTEVLTRTQPESIDQANSGWNTLSFGYHLGPWPSRFQDDPVVMTMNYEKGPPEKFIPEMKQIWSPAQAELFIEGPRTPLPSMSVWQWESCLHSSWFCVQEKKKLYESTLAGLEKWKSKNWSVNWFESKEIAGARGIHVTVKTTSLDIHRFVVFTDKGISQNFTLTIAHNETGEEALRVFQQVLGNLTMKDDLNDTRFWMSKKLQDIHLEKIRTIADPKTKYLKMIEAQNFLFAELSVDPRLIAPFFHLAGVSHLLGTSLLHEKANLFKNQDSWIIAIEPLLKALIQFAKDFPESAASPGEKAAVVKNMESLLSDYLLLEQKKQKAVK